MLFVSSLHHRSKEMFTNEGDKEKDTGYNPSGGHDNFWSMSEDPGHNKGTGGLTPEEIPDIMNSISREGYR
jgi:hypothetical protein